VKGIAVIARDRVIAVIGKHSPQSARRTQRNIRNQKAEPAPE